jgi:hypothetical protein
MTMPRIALNSRWLFAGILFFGLLAFTARTATDSDLWWHLRTGQWIVESGQVPLLDPFSFTRAGRPWVAHEWLSEIIFYELWKNGGSAALIVFAAVITTLGFMLLYLRCSGPRHWAAAAATLGALASAPAWGVRPQMFTFAFASLLLCLLEWGENRPRLLLWVPPVFLLWLNLHAGFALALALLTAYATGLVLETAFGSTTWLEARPILLRILALVVFCLALVPLNPSGAQLYRYPADTLRSADMRLYIGEWFSPDFHRSLYRPQLLVWLLLLAALASGRVRPGARAMVPLLFTAFVSLDAARHAPIFILMAMPAIAAAMAAHRGIARFQTASSAGRDSFVLLRFRPLLNATVVILAAAFALTRWVVLARNQDAREAQLFPQRAVAFLRGGNYPPRLLAYYDWGGYAIWQLYPQYRVFVDGRADLHGDVLLQFETAMQLHKGWKGILDGWNVDAVLVPPSSALAQALLLEPHWEAAFSDSAAILLLRKKPGQSSGGHD